MASEPSSNWSLGRVAALAGAAAVPIGYYMLRSRPRHDASTTQFDQFLRAPAPAQPTPHALQRNSRSATQFDTFLKVRPSARDPLDFASFLKSAGAAPGKHEAASPEQPAEAVPLDRARISVLFGTEYGFSREIAERLCERLKETAGLWPCLVDMADHPEGYDLAGEQAVAVICSTQGDGVPPTEARGFCEWLFAGRAGPLPRLHFSVLALGDRSYAQFCRCGKQLDAALAAAGATRAAPRVDVNREDWCAVDAWIAALVARLQGLQLKSIAETGGVVSQAAAAKPKRWGKSRPFYATVVSVEGLCNITDPADKDTVRLQLDLGDSGLEYQPGDALGIWPSNAPEAVDEMLALVGATGAEAVPAPSWHYEDQPETSGLGGSDPPGCVTLRAALTLCYDLRTPREGPLLAALWGAMDARARAAAAEQQPPRANGAAPRANGAAADHGTAGASGDEDEDEVAAASAALPPSDSASSLLTSPAGVHKPVAVAADADAPSAAAVQQAAQLRALMDAPSQEEYWRQRHVADALRQFSEAKLNPGQLLPALRQLQPRLYSISSSPLEAPRRVDATVAVVRYEALGVPRAGVCSTHVSARLAPGQRLPVYIHRNPDFRLPADPATPIIMVGPGTGLAPFRAFILHRLLGAAAAATAAAAAGGGAAPGEMVLFFGCRRSDQDYLYGQQLEAWAAEGVLSLHTAFSRQQAAKVYVQQRLREAGARLWQLLQRGAHFYVCGDAGSMAGAVEAALLDIISEGAGEGPAAAAAYLGDLAQQGRYQRDVWFS